MTAQALINPKILTWARERAGLSEGLLADKTKFKLEKVLAWEKGTDRPTLTFVNTFMLNTLTPFNLFIG